MVVARRQNAGLTVSDTSINLHGSEATLARLAPLGLSVGDPEAFWFDGHVRLGEPAGHSRSDRLAEMRMLAAGVY